MATMINNQEPPVTPNPYGQKSDNNESMANGAAFTFPYPGSKGRLDNYTYYSKLFSGEHYEAFRIRVDNVAYGEVYNKLRYVKANYAGLLSKVVADMLFSETIKIKVPDGDQDFIDNLVKENHLHIQFYESALANSYKGDAIFKLRVATRHGSPKEKPTVIIEDITPSIYFPKINQFNVRQAPSEVELAWTFSKGEKKYLRVETHKPGLVETKVYEMQDDKANLQVPISILNEPGLNDVQETGVDRPLIIHIPNWKTGDRHFGLSDYFDLDALFFAINNRLTKVDNILDKHSDPILAVPEGVLDEKGRVKRQNLGMVEVPEGTPVNEGKPQYVVWDASLENAFTELEQLIEVFFMVSETSPDILGMGKGQSDSGRALKYKLLRTIAKVARKKLYYDAGIKELIYQAQVLAKYWGLEVGGKKLQGDPVYPEIEWADGLPVDMTEAIDNETKRVDADLTTKKAAIMRLDNVDADVAEDMVKEIEKQNKLDMPKADFNSNPFAKPIKPGEAKPDPKAAKIAVNKPEE